MMNEIIDLEKNNATIRALEQCLAHLPQIDLCTKNLIHAGMLARTIFIPKGTTLTGAKLNCDNICVVFGDISVTTNEGLKRLTGVNIIPAKFGLKRAGFAHEDTFWVTIITTKLTDLHEIEKEITDEWEHLQSKATPQITKENISCLSQL